MTKTLLFFLTSLLVSIHSIAQIAGVPNIVGTNYTLASDILNEERKIQVYLPDNYSDSGLDYPVLYLLDGQLFYNSAVSLSNKFKQSRLSPEFIIVGISTSYPQRFGHFSSGKENFSEFILKELKPFVAREFRTNGEDILFGWEYAASLGFSTLLDYGQTFDAYILASPFPIEDDVEKLGKVDSLNALLYFSVSPDEYQVNHGTDKLDLWLSGNKVKGLNWQYAELGNEEHSSTGYTTLYHGLRTYFKYYPDFQEDSLEKFVKAGGLAYADAYSKERASRYGFAPELSPWSKYTIIRAAIRANDYSYFQEFANAFVSKEFISKMRSRSLEIADFYEKYGDYEKAIEIYEMMLVEYPDNEDLLNRKVTADKAIAEDK